MQRGKKSMFRIGDSSTSSHSSILWDTVSSHSSTSRETEHFSNANRDSKFHAFTSPDGQSVVLTNDDEGKFSVTSTEVSFSLKESIPREVCRRLEPFEALPVELSTLAEHLVSFYLQQYPKETYAFNQNLNPHPVYTNFAIAMTAPAAFQVILARSALYRISGKRYGTTLEKAQLETAMLRYKQNAYEHIRQLNADELSDKDELVASIISMGTLDKRMGSIAASDLHYSAVRRLLKSIGGPLELKDLRLKRVSCFFETIYGTPMNSYVWENSDLQEIIKEFNEFLERIWNLWHERTLGKLPLKKTKSRMEASLFASIGNWRRKVESSRNHRDNPRSKMGKISTNKVKKPRDRLSNSISQPNLEIETVLQPAFTSNNPLSKPIPVGLSGIQLDDVKIPSTPSKKAAESLKHEINPRKEPMIYWKLTDEPNLHRRLISSEENDGPLTDMIWDLNCLFNLTAIVLDLPQKSLPKYMSKLSKIIQDANLSISENNSNMMWLIQTNDWTDEHSKRLWKVAGFVWVCKNLGSGLQGRFREWMLHFLEGKSLEKKIGLSPFDFSYDSQLLREEELNYVMDMKSEKQLEKASE